MNQDTQEHDVAQLNRARIIGWVGGKPVREIRGGSLPLPEGQGGQGGQSGQQDPPADPDLIGGGQTDPPAGGGQTEPPAGEQPPAWWAAASAAQTAAMNSEIDRRINQLQNRGNRGGQQGGQQGSGQQGGQGQQQEPQGQPPRGGLDDRDLRDARSEFRDILRDSTFVLTAGEREFVNAIGTGVVTQALARTGDPYDAAAQAASTVTEHIRKLRQSHQSEMMTRLRGLGAVDESKLRPGSAQQSTTRPGSAPGQQSVGEQFAGGVSKASEMAARRGLATPGSKQPGQQ